MLRLGADENFNNDIIRGVRRRNPAVDIVRIQEEGLSGAGDAEILEWAAQSQRALLTHDVSTMTRHAYERVRNGKPMPGLFEVSPANGKDKCDICPSNSLRLARSSVIPWDANPMRRSPPGTCCRHASSNA